MRGKIAVVALGAAAALTLAGCGGNAPDSPTTNGSGSGSPAAAGAEIRVWLVSTDTPQEARDYLKTTFESQNPGSTLTIEQQEWTGLVDKYTTALSGSDSPDVVEIGNTQAATFTSVGAFMDLTDKYQELGGDKLLPGFVEAGTWDGKFYAAPYYSGARVITYSTDVVPNFTAPATWEDFLAQAKAATTDTVSGLYMPGTDWHDFLTFVWANGGQVATQDSSGKWVAGFESPEAIKGLQQFQDMFATANHFAADATESDNQIPFCAGQTAFMMAPSWLAGSVEAAPDAKVPGCSDTYGNPDKVHQFAIPGATAGTFAPVLAGGSNIAVSAKSSNPDLAYKALQIMLSDGYQKILAANGMVPALTSQAQFMPDTESSKAASNAASAAILTPASPAWATVEASKVLESSFTKIAQGDDVATVAKALDDEINATLNA